MAVLRYNHKHDAFYNPHTYEWTEKKCSDPECEFCKDRPEKAFDEPTKRIVEKDLRNG